MELAEQFVDAVTQVYTLVGAGAELLPMVLAQACVRVLPVAGAGLSVTDQLRIPLGASDELAARAERLQTTLGEGPCLSATASEKALMFDSATMASRWPVYYEELVAQTPFRSVASFPLASRHRPRFGALDLYSTDPTVQAFSSIVELGTAVVGPIAQVLLETPALDSTINGPVPAWMANDSVTGRLNVWVAVGMLIEHGHLSSANALDVLRAYSFGHGTSLDDTADQLTSQRLHPSAVLGA